MTVGQEVKHRRKRLRGKAVAVDSASAHVTIEQRSSGRRHRVTMEAIQQRRTWVPWNGHAQIARERTAEQIGEERKAYAKRLGMEALPGPTVHEMSAANFGVDPRGARAFRRRRRGRG